MSLLQLPSGLIYPNRQSGIRVRLELEGFDPCIHHAPLPCSCKKKSVGKRCKEHDLATKQLGQLIQLNILATNETIKDTSAANNAETANTAASAPTILAGTGGSAATVIDNALGTQTETQAATINAWSGTGSSGTFTVTGTITAGADRAYIEVGLRVTVNAHLYLVCRDAFTTLNVSNTGTLATTYTFNFS